MAEHPDFMNVTGALVCSKCMHRIPFIRLVKNDNTDNRLKREKKKQYCIYGLLYILKKSTHKHTKPMLSTKKKELSAHCTQAIVLCSESIPRILFQTIDRLSLFHFLLFFSRIHCCMYRFVSSSAFLFSINTP